jgi:hypothetical protein
MANQKYNQVVDLLATGRLNWRSSSILGYLCQDALFNADDKTVEDAGGSLLATTLIQGRMVAPGGLFLGYPAFFQNVPDGSDYQMLLVVDQGLQNYTLLAYFDEDEEGGPLTIDHAGTFVLRPEMPDPLPENLDQLMRLWMKV